MSTEDSRISLLEMDTPPTRPSLPLTGSAARIAASARGELSPSQMRANRPVIAPPVAQTSEEGEAARRAIMGEMPAAPAATGPTIPQLGTAMVAGAAAEASGKLISWYGRGQVKRSTLLEALAEARCPEAWAPIPKTQVAQLGRAVGLVGLKYGLVARVAHKKDAPKDTTWKSRWQLGTVSGADVGQDYGTVAATATLERDGTLSFGPHSRADVIREIRDRFDEAVATETYDAGDVTNWLRGIIISRCGGAALGVALWVPQRRAGDGAATAEALGNALKKRHFGISWMLPAIPIATTAELSQGLANGLLSELREVAQEVSESKPGAPCKGQLERCSILSDRANALSGVLGAEMTSSVLAAARRVSEVIRSAFSDTTQRALALEF